MFHLNCYSISAGKSQLRLHCSMYSLSCDFAALMSKQFRRFIFSKNVSHFRLFHPVCMQKGLISCISGDDLKIDVHYQENWSITTLFQQEEWVESGCSQVKSVKGVGTTSTKSPPWHLRTTIMSFGSKKLFFLSSMYYI